MLLAAIEPMTSTIIVSVAIFVFKIYFISSRNCRFLATDNLYYRELCEISNASQYFITTEIWHLKDVRVQQMEANETGLQFPTFLLCLRRGTIGTQVKRISMSKNFSFWFGKYNRWWIRHFSSLPLVIIHRMFPNIMFDRFLFCKLLTIFFPIQNFSYKGHFDTIVAFVMKSALFHVLVEGYVLQRYRDPKFTQYRVAGQYDWWLLCND